jgi:Pyrimidine 5'-nucleotidase (UMPH-1)
MVCFVWPACVLRHTLIDVGFRYQQNHERLLQEHFTKDSLLVAAKSANTRLRGGSAALISTLAANNIPFLIFSAGIGGVSCDLVVAGVTVAKLRRDFSDVLQAWLEVQLSPRGIPSNTHIVSNWWVQTRSFIVLCGLIV